MNEIFINSVRFIAQVAVSVAGAAALWGLFFAWRGKKKNNKSFFELEIKLAPLFFGAFAAFLFFWCAAVFIYPSIASAHEGIVRTHAEYIQKGFAAGLPWVVLITVTGAVGFYLYRARKNIFKNYAHWFFFTQFVLISVFLWLVSYTGELFSKQQVSLGLHNWHSIITLGTVIVVDYLFLKCETQEKLKKVLYPSYPAMSVAIWTGLGIEFLSTTLFSGDIPDTSQFLFNQTVIAILVINGALLSVKINEALIKLVKSEQHSQLSSGMEKVVGISGAVSFASWLTITFLDFFELPFGYWILIVLYLGFIAVLYFTKPFMEKYFVHRGHI